MDKATILVVDDTPSNLAILSRFLEQEGFEVRLAAEGTTALAMIKKHIPDLVLLDIMMPGLNGFEVCQQLKHDPATRALPIIFMTSLSSTADKIKGLSLGAQDYITKPFQQMEVLARIRIHLELYTLQKKLCQHNQELEDEINVRRRIEATLERTTAELQAQSMMLRQRNEELDAFARTVAHDLKNPVSSIIGLARLTLKQLHGANCLNQAKIERNLELLGQAGAQAYSIIDALLMLARTSREDITLQLLDMATIITRVQERLESLIHERHAQILLPSAWIPACGHASWVEEIWFNYIHNALKYGGTPPRIQLNAHAASDGMVRFEVHDNGLGLEPTACAKLFRPFVRLHHEQSEGHGLGLTIVRQISEKMGGSAGVESAPGKGSCFYFMLPSPMTVFE
jgi:two-component system, sensor histidine kinase and response regulator